jgi:hypothetical protein
LGHGRLLDDSFDSSGDGFLQSYRDDEVVRGHVADVLQAMQNGGRCEDHASGLNDAALPVADDLELAVADKEELGVGVAVGRMRHLTRWQGRFMDFDELAGGEVAVKNGTRLEAVR